MTEGRDEGRSGRPRGEAVIDSSTSVYINKKFLYNCYLYICTPRPSVTAFRHGGLPSWFSAMVSFRHGLPESRSAGLSRAYTMVEGHHGGRPPWRKDVTKVLAEGREESP